MAKVESVAEDFVEQKRPEDFVVNLVSSLHGELHVLTAAGRILKRVVDPKNFDPGGPESKMIWVEVKGPVL